MATEETAPLRGGPSVRVQRWIAAALALQLLVPTVVLIGVVGLGWDRPMRAGWQMYTSVGEEPTITVELPDGRTRERVGRDYLLVRREMRLDADLLTRLCTAEPDAVALITPDDLRVACS